MCRLYQPNNPSLFPSRESCITLNYIIMYRKTFIQKATAGLLLGIPAISILSCSGSDDGGDTNPNPSPNPDNDPPVSANCLDNGTNSTVASSAGHSHSLTVSKEDVAAGEEKTYTLSNVDNHIHQVTITASQFQTLQENNSINLSSTSDAGHTHGVTVSCA